MDFVEGAMQEKRRFKLIHTKNLTSFSIMALGVERKFAAVNLALPWIEPSINMLHLEAARAYIYGSPFASICSTLLLLEHVLRMAVWDSKNSGATRKEPSGKIFDATLGDLLVSSKYQSKVSELIPDEDDRAWWLRIKSAARNKLSHADFPAVLQIARELGLPKDYAYEGIGVDDAWDLAKPGTWGAFWHRFGDKLAEDLFVQSSKQILSVIGKTTWVSDESWWVSQKSEYERFFRESWHFENLKHDLERVYDE